MADISNPEMARLKQAANELDFGAEGWRHCYTELLRRGDPVRAIVKLTIPKPTPAHSLPLFANRQWTTETNINPPQQTSENLQGGRHVPRHVKSERADGFHIVGERQVNHERRLQKLRELLEPMLLSDETDKSFVFLCWGNESNCRIFPVHFPHSTDAATLLRELRDTWATHRGSWRKWLRPLFDIDDVEIVQISIAGQLSVSNELLGTYAKTDFAMERQHLEQSIAQYEPQEFPCPYNPSTGNTDCHTCCISNTVVEDASPHPWSPSCPEAVLHKAERRLQRMRFGPQYLRLAFSHPEIASESNYLDGEDIVYGHQDILSKVQVWHSPQLWELQFRALLISECWKLDPRAIALPLIVTVLFLMVIGAKLVYGDWATAWNVGCFLVGLASLLGMWTNHAVSK